jgi:hypothetical protein
VVVHVVVTAAFLLRSKKNTPKPKEKRDATYKVPPRVITVTAFGKPLEISSEQDFFTTATTGTATAEVRSL